MYNEHCVLNNERAASGEAPVDLCRTLKANYVEVGSNPNRHIISTPTLDLYGEDVPLISAKFQQVSHILEMVDVL
jgi:hypothetical protein